MDRSDVTRWAKRFVEIRYPAGQANVILQIVEVFKKDDAPSVPFELINLANSLLEQLKRKMKHFPLAQIEEIISWEQGFPQHLRSSLSLEDSAILTDFEHVVHAVQNFAKLQQQVSAWHLQRMSRRGKRKIRRVK